LREILLIGNGPSAVESERGLEIDDFDTVARFNAFRIEGFEKYVGTKCDIWVTCVLLKDWYYIYSYDEVYYISFDLDPKEKLFLEMKKDLPITRKIDPAIIREVQRIGGYGGMSSGAIMAYYAATIYDKVHLYGFDHFQKEKHHYGDGGKKGDIHVAEHELALFDHLFSTGKVSRF